MGKGRYVVYERASRDEERAFLSIAKEIVAEVKEPREWAPRDPKKHAGARPFKYGFKSMLLVLLLMVYHRKEYREMESHLKGNIWLLPELGLNGVPSKSTIHRAMMRLGMETLIELNDSVLSRFKKT